MCLFCLLETINFHYFFQIIYDIWICALTFWYLDEIAKKSSSFSAISFDFHDFDISMRIL